MKQFTYQCLTRQLAYRLPWSASIRKPTTNDASRSSGEDSLRTPPIQGQNSYLQTFLIFSIQANHT